MSGILHFETFIVAGILLNLTPGNDTIFILTKSISQGRRAGIISALGIGTGSIVHTLLAAFGLSIIVAKSILVFSIIKYVGAAYLLYLGYKMITNRTIWSPKDITLLSIRYGIIYREAMLTNILNPKVALFYMAFLPQFIDPYAGSTILSFILLGATFTSTGTVWGFVLAVFASAIFSRLRESHSLGGYLNKICGLALIGLGIGLAFSGYGRTSKQGLIP